MNDLTSARYIHQELYEKYQQCTTAIDTCGLKTDILDSQDETTAFQIRSSWARFLPFSAFLASRKINNLRVFNNHEYSDSPASNLNP